MTPRPRLAISVQPSLLAHMMTNILIKLGVDEVVNINLETLPGANNSFNGAIVSGNLAGEITADVIIELPDRQGSAGIGRVSDQGLVAAVRVDGLDAILRLLDQYFPASTKRSSHA